MLKLPYGTSSFNVFEERGYHYVDRTHFIAVLEALSNRYQIMLRPRRFGKSLLISVLYHYYSLHTKDDFQKYFGKYYIGKNPTSEANSYFVLNFNFSGIDTKNHETTYRDFLANVKYGVTIFFTDFPLFSKTDQQKVLNQKSPQGVIQELFKLVRRVTPDKNFFILIDEYDHFTNELIAFKINYFKTIVAQNGFVRKFYETIKIDTGLKGLVSCIFMTGVSPVTLDNLTSGFNIPTNISTYPHLNEMFGFTEEEVRYMYKGIGLTGHKLERAMRNAAAWYDGYKFHPRAKQQIYNPDMVLYLGTAISDTGYYPDNLLDENIASDYGKMRSLARFGNDEAETFKIMETVLKEGKIKAFLTKQFDFRRTMDNSDFVSLMFYLGLLTIKGKDLAHWVFTVPNFVISNLYFDYFKELLQHQAELRIDKSDVSSIVAPLAMENDIQPLIQLVEKILTHLSNRDYVQFDEKYVKVVFTSLLYLSQLYTVYNEPEINLKYPDLLCTYRTPIEVKYQQLLELKYVKKEETQKLDAKAKEAKNQIEGYLKHEKIKQLKNLRAWAIVFVGPDAKFVECLQ